MPSHSIYALCDPDSGDVRYIGRTSKPIEVRLRNHIAQTGVGSMHGGKRITKWINDLRQCGKKPQAVQLSECPIEKAEEAEREWIAFYIGKGNDLLNVHGRPVHVRVKVPAIHRNMHTIKDFLHEKNMTQAELAERLGYRQSHISMIINGERDITDGFRWRWVEAFGPSSVRFLNGDNEAAK